MCGGPEADHPVAPRQVIRHSRPELPELTTPSSQRAEPAPSIGEQDDANCFRILIATDNHIGYAEKDPVRGQDAINTFREVLELAREYQVDFVLLSGDLFHENRPSRTCMHQTIALLREYTLGDKPVSFELLSDPMDGAAPGFSFPAVNYEDPNLNVGIPVFSIHGNHDDPQGTGPEGALCALDVLSVSGLLNYFGKVDLASDDTNDSDEKGIRIRPILLRKGTTNLALYGVGNVKDSRMHYELRSNRVKMFMPEGGDVAEDDWFNLLLIHQNRVKHGPNSHVPEGMFDDSIKLVLWGHEHDCRIWPEAVEGKPYYITQPGSSVATSLAPGEAIPKHVGLLCVQGDKFQIAEIPLKTVRPFELDEVVLAEEAAIPDSKINLEEKDTITAFLRERVNELIVAARIKWEERQKTLNADVEEEMMLPLIRLKVETTGAKEMTNPVRFGQDYVGRVANPRDILQYYRKNKRAERKSANVPDMPEDDDEDWGDDPAAITTSDRLAKIRMASLVRQYLQAQNLEVLIENGLEEAVMRFVDKDDKDAIKDFVSDTLKTVTRDMRARQVDEEDVEEHMTRAKEVAASQWEEHRPQHDKSGSKKKKNGKGQHSDDSMAEDSMLEESDEAPPSRRGAAKKTSRASPVKKGKGKGKQPALFDPSSDDDDYVSEVSEAPVPKRKGAQRPTAASKRGTAKTAPATTRTTKSAAASRSRQTQLSFAKPSKTRGSKLVDSDSDD